MNKKRKIVVGSAVAAAVVIGGGAFAAATLLGDNDVDLAAQLPASSIGYVEVDLNPSLEQKAAALSLGRKLQSLAGDETSTAGSLQENLALDNFDGVDFDAAVQPWIGTQFAAAPITADAETVVSLYSVKDHRRAEEALPALRGGEKHYTLQKDFLVVTDSEADHAAYTAALAEGRLSDTKDFSHDRKALKGDIAYAWMDLGRIETPGNATLGGVPDISGRVAAAVTLASDSVNVDAKGFGISIEGVDDFSTAVQGTPALGELGADTVGGLALADVSNAIRKNWDTVAENPAAAREIEGTLEPLNQMLGITLPADADKILGDNLAVGYEDAERVRVVARGADAGTWDSLTEMLGAFGADMQTTTASKGTAIHIVFNGDAGEDVGRLRDHPLFDQALPRLETAQFAAWLDLNRIQALSDDPETAENEGVVGATISYDAGTSEHDLAVRWMLK